MSRGFVKEGDQEETPMVNPRAHLPNGLTNYVTPNGLEELKNEQNTLIEERNVLKEQSAENNRVQINFITAKLRLLEDRINSAKIVDLTNQNQDEVLFGATITLFIEEEKTECQYQIVGVDEANVSRNKVSFLSPIAKILQNKKLGDKITLQTPKGNTNMRIEAIDYKQN
ncbi:MAG: GreA/GreB family elongation factor [Bacteroidetes bacterium]|nr:GreA/GreB family elongation factor [Bacteroidota bacterium]